MKKYILVILSIILTGCLYSFEDECFRPVIQTVSSSCEKNKGKPYPLIAGYQKQNTLGKTNSTQRWKDVVACGGKYGDENISYYPQNYKKSGKFYKNLDDCMLEKGYIYLSPAQCGYQGTKWDKGVCNL